MNTPTAPGPKLDLPLVTTTCVVTWPHGATMTAVIAAHRPNETAPVKWSGDLDKLTATIDATDSCALAAYLRHQAEISGGKCEVTQDGEWPVMDEVS